MHLFFFCTNSPTPKTVSVGLEDALGSSFSSEPCAAHRLSLLGLNLNKEGVGSGTLHVLSLGCTFLKTTIRLPPTQTTLAWDTLIWYSKSFSTLQWLKKSKENSSCSNWVQEGFWLNHVVETWSIRSGCNLHWSYCCKSIVCT